MANNAIYYAKLLKCYGFADLFRQILSVSLILQGILIIFLTLLRAWKIRGLRGTIMEHNTLALAYKNVYGYFVALILCNFVATASSGWLAWNELFPYTFYLNDGSTVTFHTDFSPWFFVVLLLVHLSIVGIAIWDRLANAQNEKFTDAVGSNRPIRVKVEIENIRELQSQLNPNQTHSELSRSQMWQQPGGNTTSNPWQAGWSKSYPAPDYGEAPPPSDELFQSKTEEE